MSSTPQPNVRESPADIEARLANLGLAPQVLREALEYGRTHWMECTEAHPVGFAGMMVWGMTTYMLREGLAPSGWRAETHQGYSLTIHPEGKLAIMVVAGDERTGIPGPDPALRYRRGKAAHNLFDFAQQPLPGLAEMVKRVPLFETWMLLHHVDGTGGMHAELSRPLGIGDDGHVVGWRDRILLDLDPPEDSGAIDIPVSMKGG